MCSMLCSYIYAYVMMGPCREHQSQKRIENDPMEGCEEEAMQNHHKGRDYSWQNNTHIISAADNEVGTMSKPNE